MLEFTFRGVAVSKWGVMVKHSAHHKKPKKNVEIVEVQGRSDPLVIDDGSFSPLSFTVECLLDARGKDVKKAMDDLAALFQSEQGRQKLVFSDARVFDAILISEIEFEKIYHEVYDFALTFNAVEVV